MATREPLFNQQSIEFEVNARNLAGNRAYSVRTDRRKVAQFVVQLARSKPQPAV